MATPSRSTRPHPATRTPARSPGWSIQDLFDAQISSGWVHSTLGEIIRIAIKGTTAEAKFVDFSDLQADHTGPIGMWSPDGSTLWVGQWFSTQVYAYNLADETANYSENWTLHNPATTSDRNRKPTGIWSNGTNIYVTDPDHGRVFQYNFGDKSLTSTTYSLHADNGKRQGLWSDGTTAWVSDDEDGKLYAYQLSDFSRQSGKDIDLHSDNGEARGIWSDGATIWVLDSSEEKIYAYTLSDGSRDSGLDIDLDDNGENYNSIWSDGTTMYVVENTGGSASRDPQIHKLPLPAQSEPVVWEATLTLAVADTPWSTVGNSNEGYGSSASPLLSATHGTLSPDSFTVGSTTHTVEILAYQTGTTPQLLLFTDTGVTKADLEGLELIITVDGAAKTLAVSSATDFSSGGTNYGIYWEDSSHGYRLYDWAGKTVTVQLRTPVVDDCAGDTTTTCSVSPGTPATGDIEGSDDSDYFSLSVTSGVTYQIDAEGSPTSMGTLTDPFLYLRDASGDRLADNDDGGERPQRPHYLDSQQYGDRLCRRPSGRRKYRHLHPDGFRLRRQHPRDRRADDQRHGEGRADADGGHRRHHGQRRPGHPRIHVPVDPGGRRHGSRHFRSNIEYLHPRRRRPGQDDQGQGELHRRRQQRRDADQRGDDGGHGGGDGEQRRDGRADDHRHGAGRADADGGHVRHLGRRRAGDLQLSVEGGRRGHLGGDIGDLHAHLQ